MFLCDLIQSNLALFHAMCCNHRSVRSLGCTIGAKARPTKGGPLEKEVSDRRYIHFHRLCPGWIHQQHWPIPNHRLADWWCYPAVLGEDLKLKRVEQCLNACGRRPGNCSWTTWVSGHKNLLKPAKRVQGIGHSMALDCLRPPGNTWKGMQRVTLTDIGKLIQVITDRNLCQRYFAFGRAFLVQRCSFYFQKVFFFTMLKHIFWEMNMGRITVQVFCDQLSHFT